MPHQFSAVSWTASQHLKTSVMRLVLIITDVILKILINCQYYKDLYNSVNQYFSDWPMHDVTKSYMGKRIIQSERPMGFNVAELEKFIDIISESTLQLTFKKLLLILVSLSENNSYNYLKRILKLTKYRCDAKFS